MNETIGHVTRMSRRRSTRYYYDVPSFVCVLSGTHLVPGHRRDHPRQPSLLSRFGKDFVRNNRFELGEPVYWGDRGQSASLEPRSFSCRYRRTPAWTHRITATHSETRLWTGIYESRSHDRCKVKARIYAFPLNRRVCKDQVTISCPGPSGSANFPPSTPCAHVLLLGSGSKVAAAGF